MNVTLIAERYAKALLDMALEKNVLEEVRNDMVGLDAIIRESRPLKLFLKAPIINPGKKKAVLDELFSDFNPVTRGFINLLVSKRRENTIPDIADQFIRQYNKFKNIVVVNVRTAGPLNEALRQKVVSVMSKYTEANVQTTEVVDESIVGGFVLSWDDKQYDASIQHQIEKMKKGVARYNLFVNKVYGRD